MSYLRFFLLGALWLAVASCASNGETVEPQLVPASRVVLGADEQDPFRFVHDDGADERAKRMQASRCEFRVQAVDSGAAIDFRSGTLSKGALLAQVNRLARVFNTYRAGGRQASLDQIGAETYDWKMLLELRPEASVVDTPDSVRLLLEDPHGRNVLELRARVRWHAAGLVQDPALQNGRAAGSETCVVVPRILDEHPGSI